MGKTKDFVALYQNRSFLFALAHFFLPKRLKKQIGINTCRTFINFTQKVSFVYQSVSDAAKHSRIHQSKYYAIQAGILFSVAFALHAVFCLFRPDEPEKKEDWNQKWCAGINGLVNGASWAENFSKLFQSDKAKHCFIILGTFIFSTFGMLINLVLRKPLNEPEAEHAVKLIGREIGREVFLSIGIVLLFCFGKGMIILCLSSSIAVMALGILGYIAIALLFAGVGYYIGPKILHPCVKHLDPLKNNTYQDRIERGREWGEKIGSCLGACIGMLLMHSGAGIILFLGGICGCAILGITGIVASLCYESFYIQYCKDRKTHLHAKITGAVGMAIGATIGTFVFPVIGTYLGATLVGLYGVFFPYIINLLSINPHQKLKQQNQAETNPMLQKKAEEMNQYFNQSRFSVYTCIFISTALTPIFFSSILASFIAVAAGALLGWAIIYCYHRYTKYSHENDTTCSLLQTAPAPCTETISLSLPIEPEPLVTPCSIAITPRPSSPIPISGKNYHNIINKKDNPFLSSSPLPSYWQYHPDSSLPNGCRSGGVKSLGLFSFSKENKPNDFILYKNPSPHLSLPSNLHKPTMITQKHKSNQKRVFSSATIKK